MNQVERRLDIIFLMNLAKRIHLLISMTPGVGIGPGIPGLQLGAGFGAGCGVGAGFGYGMGKGVAHDDVRRYSNVGRPSLENGHLPSQ